MTLLSTVRRAGPFAGNGVTTSFPFTFKIFETADIGVTHTSAAGVETVLTLGSHYTVTLNANQDTNPGGTITYPASGVVLPVGETLAVVGGTDYEQDLDISNVGRFLPQAIENALDKAVVLIQQLREKVSRALLFSVNDTGTDVTIPQAATRAGKYLAFDAGGVPAASSGTGADAGLRTDLAASGGLALSGFLQAGVGAVPRTAQAKAREIVSVTDFAADGVSGARVDPTGVLNSTAGIQAAIDAGAATVIWPSGTYNFTQLEIGVHQKMLAMGEVTLSTALASGNAVSISSQYGNENVPYRQKLFDGPFLIVNTNAANAATGFYFGDAPPATTYTAANLHIDGVTVKGFLVNHAYGNNTYIIEWSNCAFYAYSVGLANSRCVRVTQVLTNSGGLFNYDNCIFQGWESVFSINLGGLEIVCHKCSFDVCTRVLENLANDSVIRHTDCRYEWDGNSTLFPITGNTVGCIVQIERPYILTSAAAPTGNPAFMAVGNSAFASISGVTCHTEAAGVAAYCTVNGGGILVYDPTYTVLGVAPTVFANRTGAGILRTRLDSNAFAEQTLAADGAFKIPGDAAANRLSLRWGQIAVVSPGIAAGGVTNIDVAWADDLTIVAAFAQVYPSASTDFYGVVSSVPLTGASHRFVVKNGAVAQGVTGTFFIVGYEA